MSVARTNILPVNLPIPSVLDPRSLEKWALAVAQALRFRKHARGDTSGAVTSAIQSIQTEDNTVYTVKAYVIGRRTSGSGALGDSYVALLHGTFRVVSGALTEVAETTEFEASSITGADAVFSVSGAKILVDVTGAAGYNITWFVFSQTLQAH